VPLPPHRRRWLVPDGADAGAWHVLAARALRAFADGYMALLLPAYLLALGLERSRSASSARRRCSARRWRRSPWRLGLPLCRPHLLRGAALLMVATGVAFAGVASFWPLLVVAFVGTLNPSSGDVSVFLPLEHARLAHAAQGGPRVALFARYSVLGALFAALGALAAAAPDALGRIGVAPLAALRAMFVGYAAIGLAVWLLYRRLPAGRDDAGSAAPAAPLGLSRAIVVRLAALFSVDAFAGGLVVNSLLALWLFERFGFSLTQAAAFFFWTGLLSAASQLAAPRVAARIGCSTRWSSRTFPANVCLVLAALSPTLPLALALLFIRSALSQMDVPTRTAYVMAVVTPAERTAAASFTAVPRSLAAALSPTLSGALLAAGWIALPLVGCGVLKIAYDLTLWRAMRRVRVDSA
jgi:hypothetical protein